MKYIVPDGCYFRSVAGVEFHAGEKLPDNYRLKKGDKLLSQDYRYDYLGRNEGGWHISVKDPRKEEYESILSDIAGKPVIDMNQTFWYCTSLTTAPTIPSSVTDMSYTFFGCHSLTTAPEIPNSITNMESTFANCTSLTTAPTIPNSVTNMRGTFEGCISLTTAPKIPNSVINMYGTFWDCKSLKKPPVIPESVVSMNFAFKDCISLEEKPKLPSTVEYDYEVFSGTPFDKSQEILEPEIDASEPEQDEEER